MSGFSIFLSDGKMVPVAHSGNRSIIKGMVSRQSSNSGGSIIVESIGIDHHLRKDHFAGNELLMHCTGEALGTASYKEDEIVGIMISAFIRYIEVTGLNLDLIIDRIVEKTVLSERSDDALGYLRSIVGAKMGLNILKVKIVKMVPITIAIDTSSSAITSFVADIFSLIMSVCVGKRQKFVRQDNGQYVLMTVVNVKNDCERAYDGTAAVFAVDKNLIMLDDKRLIETAYVANGLDALSVASELDISLETARRRLEELRRMNIVVKDSVYAGTYSLNSSILLKCGPISDAARIIELKCHSSDEIIMATLSLLLEEAEAIGLDMKSLVRAIGIIISDVIDVDAAREFVSGERSFDMMEFKLDKEKKTVELNDWMPTTEIGEALYGSIVAALIGKAEGVNTTCHSVSAIGADSYRFNISISENRDIPAPVREMVKLLS